MTTNKTPTAIDDFIENTKTSSDFGFVFDPPRGSNAVSSLRLLYQDRDYYKNFIIPFISNKFPEKVVFCDLFREQSLYGLINENFNVIEINDAFLKPIKSANENKQMVLNFVADAFNEMNNYLYNCLIQGKLSRQSPFVNLSVHRSYLDPDILIKDIQERVIFDFKKQALNNKELSSKIKNASDFNKFFLKSLKDLIAKNYPITRSSCILSTNFNVFCSGLIFDIALDKADDDNLKYNDYISRNDFLIFAEACKRYGFLVDKNVPWRLVADLNSPAMLQQVGTNEGFMRVYGLQGTKDLFSKYFSLSMFDEILHLKNFFYDAYSSFIFDDPYYELDYRKLDLCDFKKQTVFERQKLSREEFINLFPNSYWIKAYVYIKNYEQQRALTQVEFDNIVREANNFVVNGRLYNALFYIESFFKRPKNFLYYYSLQNQKQMLQDEATSVLVPELIL